MRKSFFILILLGATFWSCSPTYKITEYGVGQKSLLANREIRNLSIEKNYHIKILKLKRNGEYLNSVNAKTKILPKDTLYLFGTNNDIYKFQRIFK